ncbi:hypothetical protein BDW68DRAFT_192636 [Aspergillus falconensis]
MRTLAAISIFTEPGPGLTATLITALPDFLQPHQWQDPVDAQPTLFGFAHQTDQTIFEWLELQPEQRAILAALTACQLQPFFRSLLNHTSPPPPSSTFFLRRTRRRAPPGAHTYLFRHVFHNWSDGAVAKKILQNTVVAMGPTSRLAVVDLAVLDGGGASLYAAFLDAQRRRSLKHAGLQLRRIEQLDALSPGSDQVIEAGLL